MSETTLKDEGAAGAIIGQILELNPAFPPTIDINGASFVKNGFGVLSGYDPALEPYKTVITDFASVAMPVPTADLNGMAGSDGVIIAVGGLANAGFIIRTVDYGASWTVILSNLAHSLTDVKEFDGVYIACATGGKMYRSTDEGLSWTVISLDAGVNFKSVATSGTSWIAVSNNSSAKPLWRSKDAGLTWVNVQAPSALTRFCVGYLDGVFMVTGGTNKYWRSANDGESWIETSGPGTDTLHQFWFDERLLIIAGSSNNNNLIGFGGLGGDLLQMGGFNNTLAGVAVLGEYFYFINSGGTELYKTKVQSMNAAGSTAFLNFGYKSLGSAARKIFKVSGRVFLARDGNFLDRSINGVGIDIAGHGADMLSSTMAFKNADAARYYMRYA